MNDLCLHSVVGWFMSGLGLKLPQPAIAPKDEVEVNCVNTWIIVVSFLHLVFCIDPNQLLHLLFLFPPSVCNSSSTERWVEASVTYSYFPVVIEKNFSCHSSRLSPVDLYLFSQRNRNRNISLKTRGSFTSLILLWICVISGALWFFPP